MIFGCGSAGKGSYRVIRTFPRGCTNGPLQKRGKGDTLLHGLLWVLGCFVYLEVKNLGNQLGSHPAYLFFIEAKVRNTVFVIQGSGCQSRNITLIVLQHSIDRVHIAGRCRFDGRVRQQRCSGITQIARQLP